MMAPMAPETTLECCLCGFTDVKSKYRHTCIMGILLSCVVFLTPILIISVIVINKGG